MAIGDKCNAYRKVDATTCVSVGVFLFKFARVFIEANGLFFFTWADPQSEDIGVSWFCVVIVLILKFLVFISNSYS